MWKCKLRVWNVHSKTLKRFFTFWQVFAILCWIIHCDVRVYCLNCRHSHLKVKKGRKSSLPLTSNGPSLRFQCSILKMSTYCVHMKQQIYYQKSSIMSQQHYFVIKSWPLHDLKLWPFDLFTLEKHASKLEQCFSILFFRTEYIFIGRPWPSVWMVSTVVANYVSQ